MLHRYLILRFVNLNINLHAGGKGLLQKFDFGRKENIRQYGSDKPPVYSLKNLSCPVLYYWGVADVFTPARVRVLL